MNAILLGDKLIPIIKTVECPGTPTAYTPVDPAVEIVPEDDFNSGVLIGTGVNGLSPDGAIETQTFLHGGNTDLHEGYVLVCSQPIAGYGQAAPSWYNDIAINQGLTPIQQLTSFTTAPGWDDYTPYDDSYQTRAVAIRFTYAEASTPETQVAGYMVVSLTHGIRRDANHSIISDTFTLGGYFSIDLPYFNLVHEKMTYIEEQYAPDPDQPFDPSEPEDYDPDPDNSSDTITIPTDPPIGVTNAGFINVYKPAINSLQGLGDILFPNVASATDVLDALLKLCETMANQNLINYVIDCHVIPVSPQVGGSANIKVGFRDTGISAPKVVSDYVIVSCGSLNIAEYFHGFQDYLLTKSKLYLPFIGFVDTLPEFWQAGTISVDYKFNVIDGSFMAYVRATSSKSRLSGTVIQQYAGNACMHFPITGVNYASMVSGLIGAATGIKTSGSGASPALGAAYSAANTIAMGGDIQQSNGYNSTAAILGVRVPYLMIERPTPSYSGEYKHSKGYPSNIATRLSNVTGFTIIEDIDLSGIPLTQTEIEELRGLLKEGVYF